MSRYVHGYLDTELILNDLYLYIDPSNPKCWDGVSSKVYDLSPNKFIFTSSFTGSTDLMPSSSFNEFGFRTLAFNKPDYLVGQYLESTTNSGLFGRTVEITVFAVVKPTDVSGVYHGILTQNYVDNGDCSFYGILNANSQVGFFYDQWRPSGLRAGDAVISANNRYIGCWSSYRVDDFIYSGSMYHNGVIQESVQYNPGSWLEDRFLLNAPFRIGNYKPDDSNFWFRGDIETIMVFNRELSSTEISKVHNFLMAKYNVTRSIE